MSVSWRIATAWVFLSCGSGNAAMNFCVDDRWYQNANIMPTKTIAVIRN